MTYDYGRREFWPGLPPASPWPFTPGDPVAPQEPYQPWSPLPPIPPAITDDHLKAFLKLVEAAKEYDRKTGQPECEDPEKAQILERIMDRLGAIEKKLGIDA